MWIWEVKPGTEHGKTNGPRQLDRYIDKLQEKLDAEGKDLSVVAGFPLPTQDPIPIRVGIADDPLTIAVGGSAIARGLATMGVG